MGTHASLTERLQSFMQGDLSIADALVRELMPKLEEIALGALGRERYAAPLTKTELINELWIRGLSKGGWQVNDRGHFFALVSLGMRRILVSLARKRLAGFRGGATTTISLDDVRVASLGPSMEDAAQIVEIGIAMERLDEKDADSARMVDMHYFSGFTLEEISKETGLTVKQVRRRWERGLKALKKMHRSKGRGESSS